MWHSVNGDRGSRERRRGGAARADHEPRGKGKPVPDKDSTRAQLWGALVVVTAAAAVVAAYLVEGAALVLGVAGVEVLFVMGYVARRFRLTHAPLLLRAGRPVARVPQADHCERCRRAREALDARAVARKRAAAARALDLGRTAGLDAGRPPASAGDGVGHQRDAYVLHDERAEGEGVEDLVEPEPTR